MEPVLAFRANEFNLSQVEIGIFFIVMPIFYIPTSVYVQKVPSGIQKRAILITAAFLSFFSNLFVGPSKVFQIPNNIWMLSLGQILRGCIDPFILVPSLPEMIETALPLYPAYCESQINDISSGLFNMFLGLGQILGPLFGAQMTENYGFQTCCDYVAIICLVFALLYYVTCDGKEAFKKSHWYTPEDEEDELDNRDVIVPMRGGAITPCSNAVSVSRFSQASKIKRRRMNGGDTSIALLSQGAFERKMDLIDQNSAAGSAFKGKGLNMADLESKLKKV